MQEFEYKLIDTAGQITALVFGLNDSSKLAKLAKRIMKNDPKVEQVGSLTISKTKNQPPQFKMMGNELCINGTLAAGYLVSQKTGLTDVVMATSGLDNAVKMSRTGNLVSATFPDLVHQNYRR